MRRLVSLACVMFAVSLSGAEPTRSYSVGSHGQLVLSVPEGWTEDVQWIADSVPPTITLRSPRGRSKVLVTPLWSVRHDVAFNSDQNIKRLIAAAAERVAPTAKEDGLRLHKINAVGGKGYLFWATDKAPKPGEFPYMAQGAVPAGRLLVQFTVLTHDHYSMGAPGPLEIIKSAFEKPR